MRILLVDNGTTLLEKLKILIPGEEIIRQPQSISLEESNEFDLIILSGSRDLTVVYDGGRFEKEIALIKSIQVPMIGICFGCELIATTFGGTLRRMEERHTGIRRIDVIKEGFFNERSVEVYEGHRWIIETMPADFDILATSLDGPEIIRHRTRPIWGLQFHPENFTDETKGDEIFMRVLSGLK